MVDGPTEPGLTVVKALLAHNGKYCGFHDPNDRRCDALVTDPKWKRTKGQIVHIRADKPGGPRYDPNQTDAQRHGFNNLMVMCPSHHWHIDWLEPEAYPVEVLYEMKARAEADTPGRDDPPWKSDPILF